MLKIPQNTTPSTSDARRSFKSEGILQNIKVIIQDFSLSEVGHLDQVLGKHHPFMRITYESLHQQYFPYMKRKRGLSAKRNFKKTLQRILDVGKERVARVYESNRVKRRNIYVSPYFYMEAAQGRLEALQNRNKFNFLQELYLIGVQYSYHIESLPEEIVLRSEPACEEYSEFAERYSHSKEDRNKIIWRKYTILHAIACAYTMRHDYAALEKLFHNYKKIFSLNFERSLLSENYFSEPFSPTEAACLFYATHGHSKQVKAILTNACTVKVHIAAFSQAVRYGELSIIKMMLHQKPCVIPRYNQEEAMVTAARLGYFNTVKCLSIHLGNAISTKNIENAICFSAFYWHLRVTTFLLEEYYQQATPARGAGLLWSAYRGQLDTVKTLVETVREPYQKRALFLARRKRHLGTETFLIEHLKEREAAQEEKPFKKSILASFMHCKIL